MPRLGCVPLPFIVPAQSHCSLAWLETKTACLRDLQVGRSAWHLHFSGRTPRTRAVRQTLADDDVGGLVGHTLHLPPAQASWSMHLTDRLGPQKTPYLGFDDNAAILLPEQYTQAWVRLTSFQQAEQDSVRLAETCQKALMRQPLLPAKTAGVLCRRAAWSLAEVRRAAKHAWPEAHSTVWQTAPVAQLPAEAALGALRWRMATAAPADADDGAPATWQVVLRDETVLARQLQVHAETPAEPAPQLPGAPDVSDVGPQAAVPSAWTLTLVCDGTGSVQAWHIVAPEAAAASGMLWPCHKALQPRKRQARRARLAPPARRP